MKKYAGEEFLNKLYSDLVHSKEVKHSAKGANKNEDLNLYLQRLERITNKANNRDRLDLLKHFYYKKYVIKEENVPEKYFDLQEQIALERGYGHVTYDDKTKKEETNILIEEQKASLDRWLEYFVSEDTKHYPMWFKYYVFQNVMKIGFYDKQKEIYTKRTKETVKPFIEINREAVSMLFDELSKYLDKQEITDIELNKLVKNGSFNKIYAYITKKLDQLNKKTSFSNEGIWKKYDQGSNAEVLFNDIHGKGTGWCTAGGIKTAESHLSAGDFYVYYTKDENGEYILPRIAIRMESDKIAEIRGIAECQNLESDMENIVEEKLKEFPDKDEYKKKVSDMKNLTSIYNKYKKNEHLSEEELRFLYEIDSKIIGFGYEKDPRIAEIKFGRSFINDICNIFKIKKEEISFTTEAFLEGNKKVHFGDLDLRRYTTAEGLVLPEYIKGTLNLSNLVSAEDLVLPKKISGFLALGGLTSASGLILPKHLNGSLDLNGLVDAKNLILPEVIEGDLWLNGLKNPEELVLPKKISGSLYLNNLTNVDNLVLPYEIGQTLYLNNVTHVNNVTFPKIIDGWLVMPNLISMENVILSEKVIYDVVLNNLINLKNITFPNNLAHMLSFRDLEYAENVIFPEKLKGSIAMEKITNVKGIKFPNELLNLNLMNLTDADGFVVPNIVHQYLALPNLVSAEGIVLPKDENGKFYVPGKLICINFTEEQLIEAANRTEANQKGYKIFDTIPEEKPTNSQKK